MSDIAKKHFIVCGIAVLVILGAQYYCNHILPAAPDPAPFGMGTNFGKAITIELFVMAPAAIVAVITFLRGLILWKKSK